MTFPSIDHPHQLQTPTHQGPSLLPTTTHITSPHLSDPGNIARMQQVPMMNRFIITDPATLQGRICYLDASLLPDNSQLNPRQAEFGIFITNLQLQMHQSIHIQARLQCCTSVLMVEVAALALSAMITSMLNITGCTFLSDYQQLVHFINSLDHSNPPDWRIKPFTQIFSNSNQDYSSRLCKISKNLNHLADSLAHQALSSTSLELRTSCSIQFDSEQCFASQAL